MALVYSYKHVQSSSFVMLTTHTGRPAAGIYSSRIRARRVRARLCNGPISVGVITLHGPQTSPTTIFTSLTVAILASFRHWHFYRQSGMCSGIIYPFYAHITVRACTYMFMLEFQLVIPYHNRHTHCPRLSPYVMSDLEMVYIQHGTVQDSNI